MRLREWLSQRLREEPKPVPGARPLRTTFRTAHILAFAALYGGHVYDVAPERLVPALIATVATGAALISLDVYCAPVWLVQLRGLATLAKLALVAGVALCWDWRVALLSCVIAIGAVSSHMPGRFRYYSVLHRRQFGDGANG